MFRVRQVPAQLVRLRAVCHMHDRSKRSRAAELESASDRTPATNAGWPQPRSSFGDLLTPVEAAQYLRLDETGAHTPDSAIRTLDYWRAKGQLRATKYARRVWYRRSELDRFLERKTEQ